jgi:hypothetical protein
MNSPNNQDYEITSYKITDISPCKELCTRLGIFHMQHKYQGTLLEMKREAILL